ncbi:Amino Acid/Auxin Permease (AAAP) Family [Achlya hypogyna]|uniref:Amino Acid/Auxin Permease (AAAP) Family n=1 Tax=Achlya hypogyna TaxID=1202772 RepID=A0A1V9YL81_ACHHY|nr:Amino Acid/Auxin Permease (AAAP) Family [Achlya hypogyna]
MSERRLLLPVKVARPGSSSFSASFVSLSSSILGAGLLALPNTLVVATPMPALVALGGAGLLAFASLHSLTVVAHATQAYSYEAITRRLCSPHHGQFIRAIALLPLFGSVVIYLLVATDLLAPFVGLSRPALCALLCLVPFPLCLPDVVPHFLHWTRHLMLLCAIYLAASLSIHAAGATWPSAPATSIAWADVSYIVPIHLTTFLCHVQLLKTYGAIGDIQQALTHQRYLPVLVVLFSLAIYYAVAMFGYLAANGAPIDNVLLTPTLRTDLDGFRVVVATSLLLSIPRTYYPLRDIFEDTYFAERKSVGRLVFRMVATLGFFAVAGGFAVVSPGLGLTLFWFGATVGSVVMLVLPGFFLFEVTQGPAFALPGTTAYKALAVLLMLLGSGISISAIYGLVAAALT